MPRGLRLGRRPSVSVFCGGNRWLCFWTLLPACVLWSGSFCFYLFLLSALGCKWNNARLVAAVFAEMGAVQSLSCVQLFATSWPAARQASLSFTISWSLLKLMSNKPAMLTRHGILCSPLLLLSSIFPSIRGFSDESALHIRWPKCWTFSFIFSINSSTEYSGLKTFRIDWFDLFAVKWSLKSLLQHHNSKASIL